MIHNIYMRTQGKRGSVCKRFGLQAEGVLAGFYALSPPSPPSQIYSDTILQLGANQEARIRRWTNQRCCHLVVTIKWQQNTARPGVVGPSSCHPRVPTEMGRVRQSLCSSASKSKSTLKMKEFLSELGAYDLYIWAQDTDQICTQCLELYVSNFKKNHMLQHFVVIFSLGECFAENWDGEGVVVVAGMGVGRTFASYCATPRTLMTPPPTHQHRLQAPHREISTKLYTWPRTECLDSFLLTKVSHDLSRQACVILEAISTPRCRRRRRHTGRSRKPLEALMVVSPVSPHLQYYALRDIIRWRSVTGTCRPDCIFYLLYIVEGSGLLQNIPAGLQVVYWAGFNEWVQILRKA